MKKIAIVSAFSIIGFFQNGIQTAQAENVSWGCQVLMCAASSAPSWQGVPYCVPPMTKLIAAMKLPNFSWPICHESKTGKPAYEPYEPCPEGYVAASYGEKHDIYSRCERTVKDKPNPNDYKDAEIKINYGGGDEQYISSYKISMKRKERDNPYYFDIPSDTGVTKRFYFNLKY